MKKVIAFFALGLLAACSENKDIYTASNIKMFIETSGIKDSIIYLADSLNIAEAVDQSFSVDSWYGDDDSHPVEYNADARNFAIHTTIRIGPSEDGGKITVSCMSRGSYKLEFDNSKFPLREHGYTLDYMDSIKVSGTAYYDVLVFSAAQVDTNRCDMREFYYAAHDGLVKVVGKNGMKYNRIDKHSYDLIQKENASIRAKADSIAQAFADSVKQAIADSLETAKKDNTGSESKDSKNPIDDLMDCLDNATSLSDMKGCVT